MLLKHLLPVPQMPVLGEKLAYFDRHCDKYDAVFVGSSRFFRQIDPELFHQKTAQAGAPVRAFNFGVPGMTPPESYALVRRIVRRKPARLKTIFLEGTSVVVSDDTNDTSARFTFWHDAKHTLLALRTVWHQVPWPLCLKDLQRHARAFFSEATNLGRGCDFFAPKVEDNPPQEALGQNWDGFVPLEEDLDPRRKKRYRIVGETQGEYEKRLKALQEPSVGNVNPVHRTFLRELLAELQSKGIQPVTVVAPSLRDEAETLALAKEGVHTTLLRFNDPQKYPRLYLPENRFDFGHLNAAGATEFTSVLAELFLARKGPNPSQE